MSRCPDNWTETTLGAVNTFVTRTIDPCKYPDEVFELYSVPAFPTRRPELLVGSAIGSTKQLVAPGDVLVSKINPRINRVWEVGSSGTRRQIASSEWIVLRAPTAYAPYLRHYCSSPAFREMICAEVSGVGGSLTRAQPKRVATLPVPLAPLDEQKRIADKLDALLARVDACRERLDRAPVVLKHFRQSVLVAAMTGELTADWRAENPALVDSRSFADTLCEEHEQAGGHRPGNAAPPSEEVHDLSEDVFPDGWSLLTLRELVKPDKPITYGILKPGPDLTDGVPYLRVADFPNDRLNMSGIRRTSLAMDEAFKRSRLTAGDLLLSIRGTVGRLIEIPSELSGANITQDSARLSVQTALNSRFVLWYLRSELAQSRMDAAVKGVAVRGINIGDVRALQVPVPSRAEQDEIVRRVEKLFGKADRLEAHCTAASLGTTRLTPTLLAKAFSGMLFFQKEV